MKVYVKFFLNIINNFEQKKIIVVLVLLSSMTIAQTRVGQVSFLLGTVEYSTDGNNWSAVDVGSNVLSNWILRGDDDAELEITWENGDVSELSDLKLIKIIDVMANSNMETDWLDRMKNKIDVMFTENEASKVQGVAGIRRSEVTIEKEDSIYWAEPETANFNEGYIAFQNGDYDKAIDILENVVLQDPLTMKGEIARSCLITIYTNKKDIEKATKHRERFIADFPNSELLNLVKEKDK